VRARLLVPVMLLLAAGTVFAAAPANLPVYIEDSHAGSFYWLIQNLPLQRDYELVLIDAHSDASEILNSDSIREKILKAAGNNQLGSLARRWRSAGAIQSFNWIEPLMPHPIAKVWWIPAESLPEAEIAQKRQEVQQEINAHEAVAPRRDGDLDNKYEVTDLNSFPWKKIEAPVVVTIDLDFFAAQEKPEEIRPRLKRILDQVLELPNIQALTFSISRPYLVSDTQADLLLYEALRYTSRVVNASIQYEPFARAGEDRSEKAKDFYRKRLPVPHYEVENASSALRTLFLQNASRLTVTQDRQRWEALLENWQREEMIPRVSLWLDDRPKGGGTEVTVDAGRKFRLRVDHVDHSLQPRIRWNVLSAAKTMYNLTDDQGFANGAPRYIVYRDEPVDAGNDRTELDGEELIPFLDKRTGLGTLRVYCEVSYGGKVYLSSVVRLSRYRGEGYTGKLTEIFNLPYVYGSALLKVDNRTSADALQGADCSHFIIYGRRREGASIPYVDPKELLPYLEPLDRFRGFRNGIAYGDHGPIAVTPELVRRGLLLHFGKHVAAVYGDRAKSNVLTGETPVVHQLEGPPEITTFGAMAAKYGQIRVMSFR